MTSDVNDSPPLLLLLPASGEFCEAPLSPPSLCQPAACQNGAPCVQEEEGEEGGGAAVCRCLPGFEGRGCEKLVGVNFVDRDSYVQLQDVRNWPQANITLQVRTPRGAETASRTSSTHTHTQCGFNVRVSFRCPQQRKTASCSTTETTSRSLWRCIRVTSGSRMTPVTSLPPISTGTQLLTFIPPC